MALIDKVGKKTLDSIKQFIATGGETQLTVQQQELYKRCVTAHDWLLRRDPDSIVAKQLEVRFKISRVSAYKVLAATKELFNFINPFDVNYCWQLLWNWNLVELNKSSLRKDGKATAAFLRNMKDILKEVKVNEADMAHIYNQFNVYITGRPEEVGLDPVNMDAIRELQEEFERINPKLFSK